MKNNIILVGLVFLCVNNYAMDGSAENIKSMLLVVRMTKQVAGIFNYFKDSLISVVKPGSLNKSLKRFNKEEKLQIGKLDMSLCCGMDDSE